MTIRVPKSPARNPIEEAGTRVISHRWLKWLELIWTNLGWDQSNPMYGGVEVSALEMNDAGAGLTLTAIATDLRALGLPTAADSVLYWGVRLPNNYADGSDLSPYVEWAPTSTNTGSVKWNLDYSYAISGGAFGAASNDTITVAANGVVDTVQRDELTDIDGEDLVKGALILFKLTREGTHADDDYTGTAGLVGVGVKFQIESMGAQDKHP